jgi:hypothetical protein
MLGYRYIQEKKVSLGNRPNGGWFTGEAFAAGAEWGTVPVIPEPHLMMENLRSANPPPGALAHVPSNPRPGNNTVLASYHTEYDSKNYNIRCVSDAPLKAMDKMAVVSTGPKGMEGFKNPPHNRL